MHTVGNACGQVDAAGFHKSAGDLSAGHDINVANMTEAAAETWCKANATCSGFTALSSGGADTTKKIYFKQNLCVPVHYASVTPHPAMQTPTGLPASAGSTLWAQTPRGSPT